jgi:hypothetical protein
VTGGPHFDVVIAADPRFPGGTSSATLADARALRDAGRTVGLLPAASALLPGARAPNRAFLAGMAAAGVPTLDPATAATADLLLVTHPTLFPHVPPRPVRLRPRGVVLVANHPPRLGDGRREYDPAAVLDTIEQVLGAPAVIAPVSPTVADLLAETGLDPARVTTALPRIVHPADFDLPIRPPVPGRALVIGRHARPDAAKWPDTAAEILAAWPVRDDLRVEILGGGPPPDRLGHVPWNWTVRDFGSMSPRDFLARLDAFVYFHSRAWTEAFGMAMLEAMAAGRVVITHPSFRAQFGDGAVYTEPAGAANVLDHLRSDPRAWIAQAEAGRQVAVERHGPGALVAAIDAIGLRFGLTPSAGRPSPPSPMVVRARRRLLMVTSNGTGLGHLTRLAAIARRLPPEADVTFLTLSQGAALLRGLGFPADFVPSHQAHGIDREAWNRAFSQELAAALTYHRPDCLVFDGSVPYAGLVEVLDARPGLVSVWVRRGLWTPDQTPDPLERAAHFTAVIEPGDLAGREDAGATATAGDTVLRVGPVLLVDPADRLGRAAARKSLGLPEDGRVALVRLGGGDARSDLRAGIVRRLVEGHGFVVAEARSPLADDARDGPLQPGVSRIEAYPLSDRLEAFDLVVTEAGYNSFHECVLTGIPTIFVPRDEPEMDDQVLRARWAESCGLARCLHPLAGDRADEVLALALDPDSAAEARRRAARLPAARGAEEAAAFIWDLAAMIRAGRRLGDMVDR